MASERDTRSPPHLSIARIVSAGTRNAISGSFPIAERPGFLLDIIFDCFACIPKVRGEPDSFLSHGKTTSGIADPPPAALHSSEAATAKKYEFWPAGDGDYTALPQRRRSLLRGHGRLLRSEHMT